ncbi:MAG: PilZ domain-containing protein [Candidatus Omnitrophica bacterium]|nr:PilZ domain-containing protein [Candidatus Omnitrophota bacterium]
MTPIKERRKFMRISTSLEAEYWAKGPSLRSGQAQVFNFSREGLGIHLSDPVGRGEHVDLNLKVPGDNVPIFATAEVTWTKPEEASLKAGAGVRFVSIKPLDLARLLDFVYSRWLGGVRGAL